MNGFSALSLLFHTAFLIQYGTKVLIGQFWLCGPPFPCWPIAFSNRNFFRECLNKILHRFFAEESRALVATVEYSVEIEHKWLQDTETCLRRVEFVSWLVWCFFENALCSVLFSFHHPVSFDDGSVHRAERKGNLKLCSGLLLHIDSHVKSLICIIRC